MSERERWIVYPLLFLALGAALRDKMLKQTVADQVECKQLLVVDDAGQPKAVINGKILQIDQIQTGKIDAQQITQAGQPVVTGGQGPTTRFTLNQLAALLQMLQRTGGPPQEPAPGGSPPSAIQPAEPRPPADPSAADPPAGGPPPLDPPQSGQR